MSEIRKEFDELYIFVEPEWKLRKCNYNFDKLPDSLACPDTSPTIASLRLRKRHLYPESRASMTVERETETWKRVLPRFLRSLKTKRTKTKKEKLISGFFKKVRTLPPAYYR